MTSPAITRTRHRLLPDARRVLAKPYLPGEETLLPGQSRAHLLMARILAIPEAEVAALNAAILQRFDGRHRHFRQMLERHFERWRAHVPDAPHVSAERRLLIGAYFTHEYSVEAAALFNPSIVLAPDQSGARERRAALRDEPARGRRGASVVDRVSLGRARCRRGHHDRRAGDAPGRRPAHRARPLRQGALRTKLLELGAVNDLSSSVLEPAWQRSSRSTSSRHR